MIAMKTVVGRTARALGLVALTVGVASSAFAQTMPPIMPDVVYGHKDGMALTFDVFTPAQKNGASIIHVVSGGWISRWTDPNKLQPAMKEIYQAFLDKGFTVFAVRHGSSPKYYVPEAAADIRRAVRFIRMSAPKFGMDPNRIGIWGQSAGGHLSLTIGLQADAGNPTAEDEVLRAPAKVAAIVAYYPPSDLETTSNSVATERPSTRFPALNFDAKEIELMSPIKHITADDPPTLLLHGDKDALVPQWNSDKLSAEFKKAGVKTDYVVVPNGVHGFTGEDAKKTTAAMVDWFTKHLSGTPATR